MSYCWNNVLIKPDNSIRDALEIINNEALRVALVVDNNQHLVGVVTDGDIRRGLLKNLTLADPVSLVHFKDVLITKAALGKIEEMLA